MQPEIRSSFVYDNQTILANWYTIANKADIPDLPWEQVYAITNLNNQVILVSSTNSEKKFNLPGGHTEPGETIEQTITRELVEECNVRLLDWQPPGYQHLTKPDGTSIYQFRVYARCEKIGARMIELARPYFTN